jgi:NADH-quinone oxidoreductase subunit L
MQGILKVFPLNDFALIWAILCLPLMGAVMNGVFGRRLGRSAVTLMALTSIGVAFLASAFAYWVLLHAGAPHQVQQVVKLYVKGWDWMSLSLPEDSGSIPIEVAFSIDALSGTMALIVTGVGFLIHLYSTAYMARDPGYHRFFSYLNLFIFSMLVLILGDSLPVLFVGWEGVGLCSYLLIGFWFGEEKNALAARKAFIANRVGDFGLLVAMALLLYHSSGLDWTHISSSASRLLTPVDLALGVGRPIGVALEWLGIRYVSAASLVGISIFLGCAGKSAQIPLYVWLPDAMAGPTPVSALIHAATMVTAGVYLVCRMAPVFVLSPAAMFTVAFVGALTAVFAATIAFAQRDIKKVLAYSTVSQLGFMFLGVGVGAFTAGFFHVLTHAFFKGCLFLGAGSVIHAMHARIHDSDAAQDMRYMGGLRKHMPITFLTFGSAWAAIVGFPGTSGFFSKDEILFKAYTSSIELPAHSRRLWLGAQEVTLAQWPSWGSTVLFAMGVAGAVMTAFYMTRLVVGIFFGGFRGWTVVSGALAAETGAGARDGEDSEDSDQRHAEAHQGPAAGLALEGDKPHESPWQMTLPLVILGALSLAAGLLNAPLLHITPLDRILSPLYAPLEGVVTRPDAALLEHQLLFFGIFAFAVGVGAAIWVYVLRQGKPAEAFARRFEGLYRLVLDKWRIDELYQETAIGAVEILADMSVWADKWIVDGIIAHVTAFAVRAAGEILRVFQTGRVQAYASFVVVGLGGIGLYLVTPHAETSVMGDAASGRYVVSAAPGLGYSYRWDENGDGKYDGRKFSESRSIELRLSRAERRQIKLQVVNAFGRTAEETIVLERPPEDKSGRTARVDVYQDESGSLRGAVGEPEPSLPQPPTQVGGARPERKLVESGVLAPTRGGRP